VREAVAELVALAVAGAERLPVSRLLAVREFDVVPVRVAMLLAVCVAEAEGLPELVAVQEGGAHAPAKGQGQLAGHAVGAEEPTGQKDPAGHTVKLADPKGQYAPQGHSTLDVTSLPGQ
jgi:hypothetical protein